MHEYSDQGLFLLVHFVPYHLLFCSYRLSRKVFRLFLKGSSIQLQLEQEPKRFKIMNDCV